MDLSRTAVRITLWALVAGVAGQLVGLLLQPFRVVEDPCWFLAAGLVTGAVASQLPGTARRRG